MTKKCFIQKMQTYLARVAPSGSALRNQGATGMAKAARKFFAKLNLNKIPTRNKTDFARWLNRQTASLRKAFPKGGQHWGAARKVLNIFLRHSCYNVFVREYYGLHKMEQFLEVPLDSIVVKKLLKEADQGTLPKWPGIKGLTKDVSDKYQTSAMSFAKQQGIARVHLDPILWGGKRK